ncbi:hypothetical protein GMRT_20126 [Giardia muris]|uniref:Uncharacterized protein n=1 Tax=Giardia muris TaxID=5742 RepID=A0A4Z1STV7_GIAMU|nr:hypothetical protein GMRT_20126 [Giardia muris]|eukprot:TNJ29352.1 hypothetical protein GMRT_20126 [Giardia muris]
MPRGVKGRTEKPSHLDNDTACSDSQALTESVASHNRSRRIRPWRQAARLYPLFLGCAAPRLESRRAGGLCCHQYPAGHDTDSDNEPIFQENPIGRQRTLSSSDSASDAILEDLTLPKRSLSVMRPRTRR